MSTLSYFSESDDLWSLYILEVLQENYREK